MPIVSDADTAKAGYKRRDERDRHPAGISIVGIFDKFYNCRFGAAYKLIADCPDDAGAGPKAEVIFVSGLIVGLVCHGIHP
jgi:hypothetical protein